MTLSDVVRYFGGYVWFSAEGGFPARLLSDAAALGLQITHAKREGEMLYAACPAAHYRYLRPIARKACMRLRIYRKRGIYFTLFPYRHRLGFPVGLVCAAILLSILCGRIWVLEVEGDMTPYRQEILEAVGENGIYVGCRIDAVDMQTLRLNALSTLEEMVFVSVNPTGCVARITVNERIPTPDITHFGQDISNMVAAREGRVLWMEVYSGRGAVAAGDGVAAGDLLISGAFQSASGNNYLRRAAGRVMAETTHTLSATIPLSEDIPSPTGRVVYRPFLRFLRWDVPLFCNTPLEGTYTVEEYHRFPRGNNLTLPLGLVDKRYIETANVTVHRTEKEATVLAEQALEQQIQQLTASGVTVVRETARTHNTDDTAHTLSVTLLCQEDIAREVPLNVDILPRVSN